MAIWQQRPRLQGSKLQGRICLLPRLHVYKSFIEAKCSGVVPSLTFAQNPWSASMHETDSARSLQCQKFAPKSHNKLPFHEIVCTCDVHSCWSVPIKSIKRLRPLEKGRSHRGQPDAGRTGPSMRSGPAQSADGRHRGKMASAPSVSVLCAWPEAGLYCERLSFLAMTSDEPSQSDKQSQLCGSLWFKK